MHTHAQRERDRERERAFKNVYIQRADADALEAHMFGEKKTLYAYTTLDAEQIQTPLKPYMHI